MSPAKDAFKRVGEPLTNALDIRFDNLHHHVETEMHVVHHDTDLIRGQLEHVTRIIEEFQAQLDPSIDVVTEAILRAQAVATDLSRKTETLLAAVDGEPGDAIIRAIPGAVARVFLSQVGMHVADLSAELGAFLTWAGGYSGPAAQAGLWVNHPVYVGFPHGVPEVLVVNERIVEIPFAMAAAGRLAPGSKVLDFGATESTIALSLASLGHETIALDIRPYLFTHPNLRSVATPIEDWKGPAAPLDAVFCISTLEHVGIGHYAEGQHLGAGLDRAALDLLRGWLAPTGFIAFTAPYGPWSVDELQRVYDDEHLAELFSDWTVEEKSFAVSTPGSNVWTQVADPGRPDASWPEGQQGVVMLVARPSAAQRK